MYSTIEKPVYFVGMNYLVLSFIVVVVGGMGSLTGAVAAGFLLGSSLPRCRRCGRKGSGLLRPRRLCSTAWRACCPPTWCRSSARLTSLVIYVVAIIVLLVRPRGLLGRRKGIMED